jgi:hypothetical protein
MRGGAPRDDIEARIEAVRRSLRQRHAGIEPDAHFASRVVARLPRNQGWSFDWAVRRILPLSIGLALVLMIAVVVTGGLGARTAPVATAAATPSASQTGSDPLEWLLEGRQELR